MVDAGDFNSDAEREIALTSRRPFISSLLARVYAAEGRELGDDVQAWVDAVEAERQ